jgi:hypothetical protein
MYINNIVIEPSTDIAPVRFIMKPGGSAKTIELQPASGDALDIFNDYVVVAADQASDAKTNTDTLLNRITATIFTGITSLAQWLGALAGKQTPNSTAQTEIRATGAGSGTFNATTDSLEAVRDNQSGAGQGPGSSQCTLHFETSPSTPVENAQVWLTTDAAGTNTIAGYLLTNSQGNVTFLLDVGTTYYVWMQKDGIDPVLGTAYTAVAD